MVTLDGAGWHQPGDRSKVPGNISLILCPRYSPELNPQENVWQYLLQNYPANRVFDICETIADAGCDAWTKLSAQSGRIASIATREWAEPVKLQFRRYQPPKHELLAPSAGLG